MHDWNHWHRQPDGSKRRWCKRCRETQSKPAGACAHAWLSRWGADDSVEVWVVERRCTICEIYERVEIPEWVAEAIFDASQETPPASPLDRAS